ncbi:MAG TPA: sigma-70 family RNA polymerase sigma factor [Asanoa sp.]|nr:sigma-70 family RNA polymerase sigma factor [Asanoa sp.]
MTSPTTTDQRPEPADGEDEPSEPACDGSAEPSDADLVDAVRSGDTGAYGTLYVRHAGGARRLACSLVRDRADADDLVAETFAKVLATLRAGRGPARAFRPYLYTTLKHLRYDRLRTEQRVEFTDDLSRYEAGVPFADPTVAQLDRLYAARAFARLPERWRAVLWHTAVQGESAAQVAGRLGLTPGGVAALAFRARERLRQIYLQQHVTPADAPACRQVASRLAGYVRGRLARRARSTVDGHLATCADCRAALDEIANLPAAG